ncbi:MAG: thioredoxin family protein [Desulfobulbaceae bacterium]|nr:thioredoxin family protein [Desulfobulbaceae bacterium]
MDSPTGRMIRIGNTSIGLIGLDVAINQAIAAKMTVHEAACAIFTAVKERNYIPAAMVERYQTAIAQEYSRLTGLTDERHEGLVIRILGSGCISCNGLQTMVIDAMERAGIAADIEQIHDRDEIGRLGVTATPALMINGQVKIAGLKPSLAQVEGWIREVASAPVTPLPSREPVTPGSLDDPTK